VRVFENPNAVPRASVTYRARQSPTASELLELLSRSDVGPMAIRHLERPPRLAAAAGATMSGVAIASILAASACARRRRLPG
jgi:hypothetical protein